MSIHTMLGNGKGWSKVHTLTTNKVDTELFNVDPIFGLRVGEHCQYTGADVVKEYNATLNAFGFTRVPGDLANLYADPCTGMSFELEILPKKSRFVTRIS